MVIYIISNLIWIWTCRYDTVSAFGEGLAEEDARVENCRNFRRFLTLDIHVDVAWLIPLNERLAALTRGETHVSKGEEGTQGNAFLDEVKTTLTLKDDHLE